VAEVRYRSAGTLEFLLDDAGGFYFLEMNTRLQVEHPVTEQITGIDLVHLQLLLALQPDSFRLPEVSSPRGHAIEVRLYAEDPAQGFAPTPGRVEALRWPTGTGIRVESGIEPGQEIGTQFDSLLAKLIVHAPSREIAVQRMRYLMAIAQDSEVAAGRMHTGYLAQKWADFAPKISENDLQTVLFLKSVPWSSAGRREDRESRGGLPSPWEVS
jgi:acetyl/propionyl-CoA carboxylase alpha subunit